MHGQSASDCVNCNAEDNTGGGLLRIEKVFFYFNWNVIGYPNRVTDILKSNKTEYLSKLFVRLFTQKDK